MATQLSDRELRTAVAQIELHKVRFGKYPRALQELRYVSQLDLTIFSNVAYFPNQELTAYYVEHRGNGMFETPKAEYPDEFWQGTGFRRELKPPAKSATSLPRPNTPLQPTSEGPVWFWFSTCGGPLMTLEVQVDTRVLHRSTFPLCRANREAVQSQGQVGRIEVTWRSNRAIVWEGYRDAADRTAANEELEVDIWQAGADPDTMILGVSAMTGNSRMPSDSRRIVMNTVHIAHPSGRDESAIASGVVVRTYQAVK
jgi:hypothetical protein